MRFAGGFGRPFSFVRHRLCGIVCAGIVRTPHDCVAPIHSSSRSSTCEKNVCNRKNTGVTCAPIAAALFFTAAGTPRIPAESPDETRLPHRQPVRHVALPSRCGRMRAVEGLRQSAHAARQRHTPRLIPFPEIGRPDLRGTRTPSDTHPGVFLFRVRKYRLKTRFPERFFRIVASERARILRDAKGFALLFSGHASRFGATRSTPASSEASCRERPDNEVRARVAQSRNPP